MLEKEQIINLLEYYKSNSRRVNVKFDYDEIPVDTGYFTIKVESLEDAVFTVNNKSIKFGTSVRIHEREFKSQDDLIGVLNNIIFKIIEMLIWQRPGNIITKR